MSLAARVIIRLDDSGDFSLGLSAFRPKNSPGTLVQIIKHVGGLAAGITPQEPLKRDVRLISRWDIKPISKGR